MEQHINLSCDLSLCIHIGKLPKMWTLKKKSWIYFFLCDSEFDGLVNNIMQTADVSVQHHANGQGKKKRKIKSVWLFIRATKNVDVLLRQVSPKITVSSNIKYFLTNQKYPVYCQTGAKKPQKCYIKRRW